jgi:hypothetical protein
MSCASTPFMLNVMTVEGDKLCPSLSMSSGPGLGEPDSALRLLSRCRLHAGQERHIAALKYYRRKRVESRDPCSHSIPKTDCTGMSTAVSQIVEQPRWWSSTSRPPPTKTSHLFMGCKSEMLQMCLTCHFTQ